MSPPIPRIGILTLIALIGLLFVARYSRGLFDLVRGINRWMLRVRVYSTLLRDDYPPFRLDQGARDPGAAADDTAEPRS